MNRGDPVDVDSLRAEWTRDVGAALEPLGVEVDVPGTPVVVRLRPPSTTGAVVIHVPGRWGSGALWACDAPQRDLRRRPAVAGHEVVTVRWRRGARPGRGEDSQGLAAVRTKDLLDDVRAAVEVAREDRPQRPLVLCGYSMGATIAFLAAAEVGAAGLVVLDGGLPSRRDCRERTLIGARVGGEPDASRAWADRSVARLLADPVSPDVDHDRLRWRLAHDRWWPGVQVEEIRRSDPRGVDVDGRLRAFRRDILCVVATDRELMKGHRSVRTAAETGATQVHIHHAAGLTHDDIGCGAGAAADAAAAAVVGFVGEIGAKQGKAG